MPAWNETDPLFVTNTEAAGLFGDGSGVVSVDSFADIERSLDYYA
jgi:hypothetical protein